MRDVLCQLPFQADLLFFLSDVVDADLKAHILEDDALYDKSFPVFIDSDGHSFLLLADGTCGSFVDEVRYLFELADIEYLFCRFQV